MGILKKTLLLFTILSVLGITSANAASSISRDSCMTIASTYCYAVWTANAGNCNNNPNPNNPGYPYNYFTVGEIVTGIDYEWGGYDTLSACLLKLYNGATAGDSYTLIEYPSNYWTGVDCSGYNSRCWATNSRYVTSTFPDICTTISYADFYRGDMYDWESEHCRLFDYFVDGTNYIMDYESEGGGVGVVHQVTPMDNNYVPLRYLNIKPFNPPPIAGFYGTPTAGVGPFSVSFVDTSANNPTKWAWTFGDGGADTTENPVHAYSTVGSPTTYTVQLIATSSSGTSTTIQNNYITVIPPILPSAGFYASPTSGDGAFNVNFVDTSMNFPASWNWNFGDGSTTNTENPMHIYSAVAAPTSYTVQLIVANSAGISTATWNNYIYVTEPAPQAFFYATPTTGLGPLPVSFVDNSINSPTSWAWDFGDGGTATTQNPAHTYNKPTISTTYTVQLIATNSYGSSTAVQTHYISVITLTPTSTPIWKWE